jgi:hypothetical protein
MQTTNLVQLLQQKGSSAMIDIGKIEARLTRLSNSTARAGIRTNLLCVVRMFREYIATLDEAIGLLSLVQSPQSSGGHFGGEFFIKIKFFRCYIPDGMAIDLPQCYKTVT